MKFFASIISIVIILTFIGCKEGKEKQTGSGMKYRVYREANGKKPKPGDWVTVSFVYKDAKDSVLMDTRSAGKPLRFKLPEPKFPGSFEEGLLHLGEGDSATFFINGDSLYEHVISRDANGMLKSRPEPGTFLKFDVALERVQSYQEAEMEIAMNESRQEKAELKTLESYLREKNLTPQYYGGGFYMQIIRQGNGEILKAGDVVSLNYTGRFLNGVEFDSNKQSGKPYSFILGKGYVIRGWDMALQTLRPGDQVMLICPSPVAYGSEGLRRPNSLLYRIPPLSTLIFDIEVVGSRPLAGK